MKNNIKKIKDLKKVTALSAKEQKKVKGGLVWIDVVLG